MTSPPPPREVLAAYAWSAEEVRAIPGGLINATFEVIRAGRPVAVLQRLHPVFGAEVNVDIDAVTAHLAAAGLVTPRVVRTQDGALWTTHDGRVWRALTWVAGETVDRVPDARWAEAGGELVGRFHRAVASLVHTYAFTRAGVHDTAAHLARLSNEIGTAAPNGEAVDLGRDILAAAAALPPMPTLPTRHCHGDLKISNLRFTADPPKGLCLLDLDTLGRGTIAFEIGDAMRSWCNPHGEDRGAVQFDLEVFAAAIGGFRSVADDLLTDVERASIVTGLETVCLELAARFCVDAFRDEYFGWDPARFPSRRAHNLVRARRQLELGLAVRADRAAALDVVRGPR